MLLRNTAPVPVMQRLRRPAALAGLVVVGGVLLFASDSAVKTVGLFLLIFLAGHAALALILGSRADPEVVRSLPRNMLAVALGPCVVLFVTGLLRTLHLNSPAMLGGSLLALVAAVVILRADFRRQIASPQYWFKRYSITYLAIALMLWFCFYPHEYPFLKDSAVYVTQGFDLFFQKDAALWPYFGELFSMPLLYVTHMIGATFALISSPDHSQFYVYGIYWTNIILAPIVPIGAYLFFKRYLSWWAAGLAAATFCAFTLNWKVWSIRGETLGWVFGFAFLLTLSVLIEHLRRAGPSRMAYRLALLLCLTYFGAALAHGVVSMVISFMAAAMVGHFALNGAAPQRWRALFSLAVFSIVALGLLGASYVVTFSDWSAHPTSAMSRQGPIAGEPDAALLVEKFLVAPGEVDARPILASPPLAPPLQIAQVTAFLPLGGLASFQLKDFPAGAVRALESIPPLKRLLYVLALVLCSALYAFGSRTLSDLQTAPLFWACVSVYVLSIAFSVYLDLVSVSVFPLAAVRRSYVYVRFFYGLALALTLFEFLLVPAMRRLSRQRFGRLLASLDAAPIVQTSATTVLLALVIGYSIFTFAGRELTLSWMVERVDERVRSKLIGANPPGLEDARASYDSLFDALRFIRENTSPEEWVFSNLISDNQFWYLTEGRHSVLEGSVMYQIYDLQRRAASRLDELSRFAMTADSRLNSSPRFRYVLLYKMCQCQSRACYGYNVVPTRRASFARNPSFARVFDNREFTIFRLSDDVGQPGRKAFTQAESKLQTDCFRESPPNQATLGQGINFAHPGFPSFLNKVSEMLPPEPSGRWSVGKEISFTFQEPLPKKFTIVLKVEAYTPNVGPPVIVRAGSFETQFVIINQRPIRIPMDLPDPADTITFSVPAPTLLAEINPRFKRDPRSIGMFFYELRIEPDKGS